VAVHNMVESARYADQGMWMAWIVICELIQNGALIPNNDPIASRVHEPEINRAQEVARAILEEVRNIPSRDRRKALIAFTLEMTKCVAARETQESLDLYE